MIHVRRLLPSLVLFAALPASSASLAAASPERVSVAAHGVQLSMTVPRGIYRQNALIAVRVTLRNISTRTIWESPMVVGFCSRVDFLVQVLDKQGQPLAPLPPAPGPYPDCPAPLPYPLHAGETVSRQVYVVLMADRIRATANINTLSGTRNYEGTDLTTPTIRLQLRPASAPPVTVQTLTTAAAVVTKPPGARGPLRYQQWSVCGATTTRVLDWTTAANGRVDTGCSQPSEWHVVAGWVNYPVAFVNIQAPVTPTILTPPFSSVPYTVHVHQVLEVKVLLLGPGMDVARANPAYLRLMASSAVGAEPVRYDWRWQAIAPGNTRITINRRAPSGLQYTIRLHILP